MRKLISRFVTDDAGSNALEYGLIVAFVSLAVVVGATAAGTALGTLFSTIGTRLTAIVVPAA